MKRQRQKPPSLPEVGSYWRYKNGTAYRVLLIANAHTRQKAYPTMVVFMGPGGKVWCLPVKEWNEQPLTAAPDAYIEV